MEKNCRENIRECIHCAKLRQCRLAGNLVRNYYQDEHISTGTVHAKNKLNHLDGGQWLYFTKTLWTTAYAKEFSHELRKQHGANKPPRLMQRLIEFFTKEGEHVLDPFAGVGGTLVGAALCRRQRNCTGIEINKRWIEIYHRVIAENPSLGEYPLLHGDCVQVLQEFPQEKFHFIATDPPYNIHLSKTMCVGDYSDQHKNRRTDYDMRSQHSQDLANAVNYDTYLENMAAVLYQCFRVLKTGGYMAIILRNAYQSRQYVFTHADVAKVARAAGFVPKGEIIWYQAGTRLRPYGYPFAYVPNIAHQYILILRKEAV